MNENMKTYLLPPMWKDVKRCVPEAIKKILEDDDNMRSIEIYFSANVDEAPTLTYTIERYAWSNKEAEQ